MAGIWSAASNFLAEIIPVVAHTVVIYVFLVLVLSLFSYRQISELSITELVIVAMLGSSIETALIAGSTSLEAGLVSAATLLVCNKGMSLTIRRWRRFRRVLLGHPVPLVYKGRLIRRNLLMTELTQADLMEGIRQVGYERLDEVKLAMLEIDGTVSVIPVDEK